MEKFSYSKINTYENCGWRYKLTYEDKHFVDGSSIAADFGTLVHFVEETIAKDIIQNDNEPVFMIDMDKYINLFIEGWVEGDKKILGIKSIKEKYPEDFYKCDKSGMDYNGKANQYLNKGIYFLQDFLNANRHLTVIDTEKSFEVTYEGITFHGFIDRVFRNTLTGELIIEDIKTWPTIEKHDLVTPLQFVIYVLAATELYQIPKEKIQCFYSLPLAVNRYAAGTRGFVNRGLKKLNKLLTEIDEKDFVPNPSPLCAFCPFSETNPNQPEEAKNLCPYFSHWTRENNKDFTRECDWFGIEHHEEVLADFLKRKEKHKIKENILRQELPEISLRLSGDDITKKRCLLLRRS